MYFKKTFVFIYFICVFGVNLIDGQVIKTTTGSILGRKILVLDQIIEQYLGIPYAMPPIGNLRFAKPKPIVKPIEGVIDGTKPKYSCIQSFVPEIPIIKGIKKKSEDCLTLNIWTQHKRSPDKLKPVMIWIFGGGYLVGSIFQDAYNGSVLATHDLVFVSVNYRLGWFGWLYGDEESAPGNVGLYDQNMALQWVWENIHMFGGDSNQITLAGLSAGSWSIGAHILSPLSRELFKRAIMMSGTYLYNKQIPVLTKEMALKMAKNVAKLFLCFGDNWLQCLRSKNAHDVRWYKYQPIMPLVGTEFLPLLAQSAFEQEQFYKDVDILTGNAKNEGTYLLYTVANEFVLAPFPTKYVFNRMLDRLDGIFHNFDKHKLAKYYLKHTNGLNTNAVRKKMNELTADLFMKCPTYVFAKLFAQHSPKQNVFFYEFNHKLHHLIPGFKIHLKKLLKLDLFSGLESFLGVYHFSDIAALFGHPFLFPNSSSQKDTEFTKEYMKLFTDFVKYGNPDPKWPKLNGTVGEPGVIRKLNPDIVNPYFSSKHLEDVCFGVWKGFFS